jgi:hypothetical protein
MEPADPTPAMVVFSAQAGDQRIDLVLPHDLAERLAELLRSEGWSVVVGSTPDAGETEA